MSPDLHSDASLDGANTWDPPKLLGHQPEGPFDGHTLQYVKYHIQDRFLATAEVHLEEDGSGAPAQRPNPLNWSLDFGDYNYFGEASITRDSKKAPPASRRD